MIVLCPACAHPVAVPTQPLPCEPKYLKAEVAALLPCTTTWLEGALVRLKPKLRPALYAWDETGRHQVRYLYASDVKILEAVKFTTVRMMKPGKPWRKKPVAAPVKPPVSADSVPLIEPPAPPDSSVHRAEERSR